MDDKTYTLKPIGRVKAGADGQPFSVLIDPAYREGLLQLESFSHAMIFWWADRLDGPEARKLLTTELPYARGQKAGVFACRSEYRPNPIAVTTVPILNVDVDTGTVLIPWIDAMDGTPVLDLKPYLPSSDRVRDVRVAPWMADWPVWMEEAGEYFAQHAVDFGDA
jgi:tRNA-Thr(GGU) m(6)t(6)A37 methyltransferase TsaA